jgi:hypothetical protein
MTIERFPVEASHIMMFARAISDPNSAYADGSSAPPTFAIAGMQFDPDNPLRPKPGQPWFGSGREPTGVTHSGDAGGSRGGGRRLHAEQHFEYHLPLRAGMVLVATERPGETWEKASKRGGQLVFDEQFTEYRDAATGDLVITARMVGVQTSKVVEE